MEAYLEDNRSTIDEICESYDECNKECPLYEFCHQQAMTREEAIKELNNYYDTTDEVWLDFPKLKEALDMAISALSENRGEPTYYPPCIDCNKKMDEIRRTYDKLKELPSVGNKGEWIPISSIDEIPKEGAYWVTFEYKNGYRETSHIGWDKFHEHWDDEEGWALDDGDYIIAYMPYFEPKPYNPKEVSATNE